MVRNLQHAAQHQTDEAPPVLTLSLSIREEAVGSNPLFSWFMRLKPNSVDHQ